MTPDHILPPPPWPRAADRSTMNPTVQQQAVSRLVKESALTLLRCGSFQHARIGRVLHVEQTSTGEAA